MEEKQADNLVESTHSQYTRAYVQILKTYNDQLYESIKNKNNLKIKFFKIIRLIMGIMAIGFIGILVLSLGTMILMIIQNISSRNNSWFNSSNSIFICNYGIIYIQITANYSGLFI